MELNVAPATVTAASTPEEAAVIFKQAAAAALAQVMADALGKALGTQTFAANPALAGWQDFVGGVHFDFAWAKPALSSVRPLTQITAYSPIIVNGAPSVHFLGGIEVGISIKGTF
ncbi:hypothetical protein [Sphingobium yanoikuyae]|jgi:hypothetical protein|uniref:hypothetical protein n=1 Tax=Sphingobium yanoikuyae TaxID=13690 RepID=UPI0035C87ABB